MAQQEAISAGLQETGESQVAGRDLAEKHLGRGLEDVSRLFSSPTSNGASSGEENRSGLQETPQARSISLTLLSRHPGVTREQLLSLLGKNPAALEEGMRAIDTNIACEPYVSIDLMAADSTGQLVVVDIDTTQNDGALLRAVWHFDWLIRNLNLVRRMYYERALHLSTQPRILLLAPQFSPMLTSAAHRMTGPRVKCVRYHLVALSDGAGIFFDAV
jgi:hypothetical protein